jgi:two-component system CheB/CheR fusion protein
MADFTYISAERLEHHFVKEGNRYRVAKHIRDMCVFSTHDLVKDPPFSKLDMIAGDQFAAKVAKTGE